MRSSRWVPVLTAVITVLVLQAAMRDGMSVGQIVALVMLLLLGGFLVEQYLQDHRR